MPSVLGQDGTNYELSPEQAEQYYSIKDFAAQQEFLKNTGAGGGNALVARPSGNALGGGLVAGGVLAPNNQLAPYSDKATMDWEQAKKLIMKYESAGGQNIPNYRFDPTHTAQGYFQITNSTWRGAAPKVGVDLSQYPNAMSAPYDVQEAVARKLYSESGFGPWAPYNSSLARAIGMGENPPEVKPAGDNALVPQAVPRVPATGSALGVGALSGLGASPWTRLLLLSSMLQSGGMTVPLVRYNPKLGMTTIESRPPSQLGSETGELPQTTRIPVAPGPQPASAQSRFRPVMGPPSPQTPTYTTRTGMRDYWSLPEALSLATGESGV